MLFRRRGPDDTFKISGALPVVGVAGVRPWRLAVPLLAFLGIALSIVVTYFTWAGMLSEKHAEVAARVDDLIGRVKTETETSLSLSSMRGLRAYLDTAREVTSDSFSSFAKNLRANEVGTIGYGYAARVGLSASQDGEGAYQFIVQMIEPAEKMEPLRGTDILRISEVSDAVLASIKFDEVRLTAPLNKHSVLPGYNAALAFYPYFKMETPSYSDNSRNADVDGVIFAVYDIEGIIGLALRKSSIDDLILSGSVGLSVKRETTDSSLPPIFMTGNFDKLAKASEASFGSLVRSNDFMFNVSNIPLRVTTLTDLTTLSEQAFLLPGTVMLIGLMLTATLSAFAHTLITREESVKALVRERTWALQESQKLFEDMANVSADWFWETDAEHKFTYISEKFEEVSGLNPMLFLNRSRLEAAGINLHDAADFWREHFETLQNHLAFHDFRYTMPRSNTLETHLSISGKPMFDADGMFTGYRGSGRDVTAEETAKRRLQESEERLYRYVEELEVSRQYLEENTAQIAELAENYAAEKERAEMSERSKSEFLASMSHEIRTPMTGVMGFADMLLDSKLAPDDREKVIKIKGATHSLLTIINDILDLSKMDAGRLDIEKLDFNFPYTIEEAVDLVRERARLKGLYVQIDTNSVPVGVNGDPTRIRQILINLVGNAVKFTHRGGITVRADVVESSDQKMIRIGISDTGIGISEENQRQLFHNFSQGDASISRRYEGTGLGLAISKRLVELMGGEIGVTSQVGHGSEFWFQIPLRLADTDVSTVERLPEAQHFLATRALNILIAEDNRLNQRIIAATVEKYGHHATVVDDGEEAIKEAAKYPYDLMLCDVRMPNMSGPDATRAIREMTGPESKMPIIALTADAMEEHVRAYLDAGMNACVTKPIDRPTLLLAINDVMGEKIHIAAKVTEDGPPVRVEETVNEDNKDFNEFLRNLQSVADEIERTRETDK